MSRILIVDDEANILSALKRTLNAKDEFDGTSPGYEIDTYTDARAALVASEEKSFDLVISDYRMPELDGVAFLTDFRYRQPDCIRIILSGMTDLAGLVLAINEVEIYRFISKPWNDFELRSAVAGALRFQKLAIENQQLADELRKIRSESHKHSLTQVNWGPDGSVLLDGDETS
ncbi:response regulator [Iodobacter fluviatilis]|uniref:Hydrogenase transcriptional regulatory protein hupR1 n=1 Tax=Iodobacter fluviatilis TaxID=537 RepID=A0A377SSH3_9NEIS|nr:response regulator [Iodobacter fluviatilis]TCU85571.1 response regulator receiver domain-containing protein [Iodobacter fluviatilis]STR44981.1 Hydrogenase transcriptional regulatory protein hupR1 [Iodobacter fluviatilis]